MNRFRLLATLLVALAATRGARAQNVDALFIARDGRTAASIVVAADAGQWEKQGASDLQKYIEMMSRAKPALVNAIPTGVSIVVGKAALQADASLQKTLDRVAKKNPLLRADAIVMKRSGNVIYLAGSNDESHYFAVSRLLQNWGVRWYAPTDFGEYVPVQPTLQIGKLDMAYAPPFEIRRGWNRLGEGVEEWNRRNFMGSPNITGGMGALSDLTADIAPAGKTVYQVPFAENATAQHVADKIDAQYAAGQSAISIAAFIGEYSSDSARDKELNAGIVSKYANISSSTDAMLELYVKVAEILRAKYPNSKSRLIGIAYASVALPPQRVFVPPPNLVMWFVPVDVDPNHSMDDARSPLRQEYRAIMHRWAELMQGRLGIYDYEEKMLVWRDLPNPSHDVFRRDIREFQKAGILGFSPEPRGSLAINFLNVYFRGQLMWNPNADVDKLLADFYPKFYGPAAKPMADYWNAIFAAWRDTLATEHEHFIAPAIYTPQLMAKLGRDLKAAEAAIAPLRRIDLIRNAPNVGEIRNERNYLRHMSLARLSFNILNNYMEMVRSAASHADYPNAARNGTRGLANVLALAKFNPGLTPYPDANLAVYESGGSVAQWPGEVQQMKDLAALTDGTKGNLVAKLPLEWAFRRDPHDSGLARGWAYTAADLSFWNANKAKFPPAARKDYPNQWETVRSDLYFQAQGILHPDAQSFSGHYWYQTNLDLTPAQTQGNLRLMFPGLFNDCWLYVNGALVAHRGYKEPWWNSDYKFEWDIDLSGKLKPGANLISLRGFNPRNFGGMFRRPFLYRAKN